MRDVNAGWMINNIHANGASFFFICSYILVAIYYGSYRTPREFLVWSIGVIILVLTIILLYGVIVWFMDKWVIEVLLLLLIYYLLFLSLLLILFHLFEVVSQYVIQQYKDSLLYIIYYLLSYRLQLLCIMALCSWFW